MSENTSSFLTEAETLRRLNIGPRKGYKLRAAGIVTPDQTVGRVRLYWQSRLDSLAAAVRAVPARK